MSCHSCPFICNFWFDSVNNDERDVSWGLPSHSWRHVAISGWNVTRSVYVCKTVLVTVVYAGVKLAWQRGWASLISGLSLRTKRGDPARSVSITFHRSSFVKCSVYVTCQKSGFYGVDENRKKLILKLTCLHNTRLYFFLYWNTSVASHTRVRISLPPWNHSQGGSITI
jgi:hypothetical protein